MARKRIVGTMSFAKSSFNLLVGMIFQIFFMTFRNESEHCISNKTKLTYKCLSRMKDQSHHQAVPFLFLLFSGKFTFGRSLTICAMKKWFFTKYHFFFGLEFASIYLKYCVY